MFVCYAVDQKIQIYSLTSAGQLRVFIVYGQLLVTVKYLLSNIAVWYKFQYHFFSTPVYYTSIVYNFQFIMLELVVDSSEDLFLW